MSNEYRQPIEVSFQYQQMLLQRAQRLLNTDKEIEMIGQCKDALVRINRALEE